MILVRGRSPVAGVAPASVAARVAGCCVACARRHVRRYRVRIDAGSRPLHWQRQACAVEVTEGDAVAHAQLLSEPRVARAWHSSQVVNRRVPAGSTQCARAVRRRLPQARGRWGRHRMEPVDARLRSRFSNDRRAHSYGEDHVVGVEGARSGACVHGDSVFGAERDSDPHAPLEVTDASARRPAAARRAVSPIVGGPVGRPHLGE